jgi:hypothetical protein
VTELRLGELDPANLPTDIAEISSKIDGIGSVGGFQTAVAESFTLTTGTVVAGTYASTHAEDGVRHQIADSGGVIDGYYEFDISTIGVPSAFQIIGALTGSNDSLSIMAYNWSTLAWDTLRSYSGTVSSSDTVKTGILLSTHVSDAGKVRIRFYGTGLTSANLYVNQLFSQYGVVQSATGYEGGAVWIDTVNGTAGSVPDVNGTADNPVDNMADALVIAAAKSLARFHAAPGSAITLPSAFVSKQFEGCGWTLDLNGQDISYSRFACAVMVTGAATAPTGAPQFDSCDLGAVTLPPCHLHLCGISASLAGAAAGEYAITHCYSLVPGSGTPTFNFSGLGSATGINVRNWSGGSSWTLDSNCTLSLEVLNGGGQTFTTGGANIELRGRFRASTFTLSGAGAIQQVGTCGPITISGNATSTVRLYGVRGNLTNTSTGTTLVDQCVTEQKLSLLSTSTEVGAVKTVVDSLNTRTPAALIDGATPAAVVAMNPTVISEIEDALSTNHGSGSWETADLSGIPDAVDLELSTNHGSGSWASSGGGVGVNTVTITVTDGVTPLPDVSVAIRNSTDTATLCSGYTDTNGRFSCSADDGDYKVRLQKNWYNFTTQDLEVVGDTSATYEGTAANPVDPGSGKQTIYGYIKDVTGVHVANATVAVRGLSTIPVSGGNLVSPLCESVVSGSDGSFSINVLKGIEIEMRFIEDDETFYSINLTVTADGTKEITTYLTA